MNKSILRLAIPNIVSNITVPLLGIVDLALMGTLDSYNFMGAVALGSVLINFLYWNFAFIRMSASGIVAQFFGARDFTNVAVSLGRSMVIALGGAVLILILQKPIAMLGFYIINGDAEVESLAYSYFRIRILAAPASIGLFAFLGWFIGLQNSRIPMVISILINVVNIGANFLFVKYFDMASDGVAWGTVIAQYCGLLVAVFYYFRYYSRFSKYLNFKEIFHWDGFKEFFKVNRDIFIRTFCIIIVISYFTAQSAGNSTIILDVNAVLLQFFFIFSFFLDGFALAAEALVGKFIGAKNKNNLLLIVRYLFLWGLGISFLFSFLFVLFGENMLYLLASQQEEVRMAATEYLLWTAAIPLAGFVAFTWDGIYIGGTASREMLISILIATIVFFFPINVIFKPFMGNHALWMAFIVFLISRSIVQTFFYKKAILNKL